ncbi:MAG: hypothetical protein KatS3mg105_2509 [Gemmatales bacterium]|nr:MAG: hypothetical protein KatS3mg105_2509 [Gemmatales bacterium]
MNALANKEVGKYLNEYFVSSYQKVGTFRVVRTVDRNGRPQLIQKQGGNVATYFCAPDGRVLHVIAGPVNADVMLREAKWVVESVKKAMKESKGDGGQVQSLVPHMACRTAAQGTRSGGRADDGRHRTAGSQQCLDV